MPLKRAAMFVGGGLVVGDHHDRDPAQRCSPRRSPPRYPGLMPRTLRARARPPPPPRSRPAPSRALRGTTALNGRLADEATALRKALDAKKFRTGDVQKVLRRMAIDARAGVGMLGSLATWPEAAGQQAALQVFYADLQRQIDSRAQRIDPQRRRVQEGREGGSSRPSARRPTSTRTRASSPRRRAWSSCRSRSPKPFADEHGKARPGSRYGASALRYPVSST